MSDCGYTPEELAAMNEVDALPGENCVTPWVPDHAARVRERIKFPDLLAPSTAEALASLDALLAERDEARRERDEARTLNEAWRGEAEAHQEMRLAAERERDEAREEVEALERMGRSYNELWRQEKARAESAEQLLDRARDSLRRIKENAESWHGLGEDGPRRALEVIAKWCDAALSGSADTTETA